MDQFLYAPLCEVALCIDVIDQAKARTTIVDGKIAWGV
jgi:hypothetical protein